MDLAQIHFQFCIEINYHKTSLERFQLFIEVIFEQEHSKKYIEYNFIELNPKKI